MSDVELIESEGCEHALARLYSGELTSAEAEAIRLQAVTDSEYLDDLMGAQEFLADLAGLVDDEDILSIANGPSARFDKPLTRRWPALSAAAGVVLALVVGMWSFFDDSSAGEGSNIQRYVTRVGEQKTVTLTDGSVVSLNTATQIMVDFSGDARRIVLDRGEAYFDVTKDESRPFSVELGMRSVTVLGTEFNLYKSPSRYELAVLEGVVSLHYPTDAVSSSATLLTTVDSVTGQGQRRVAAGWLAQFDVTGGSLTASQPEDMERYQTWRTGLVQFYREPLYQVIQELNRYSAKKILIEDKSIMDLSVYAAVNVNELGAALNALEQLLPVTVIRHFDRIVIVGSNMSAK